MYRSWKNIGNGCLEVEDVRAQLDEYCAILFNAKMEMDDREIDVEI